MKRHILVETRSPHDIRAVDSFYDLAQALANDGEEVTLFLLGAGVAPLRGGPYRDRLFALAQVGVEIMADRDSLKELAVDLKTSSSNPLEVSEGSPKELARFLLGGEAKVVWHGRGKQ